MKNFVATILAVIIAIASVFGIGYVLKNKTDLFDKSKSSSSITSEDTSLDNGSSNSSINSGSSDSSTENSSGNELGFGLRAEKVEEYYSIVLFDNNDNYIVDLLVGEFQVDKETFLNIESLLNSSNLKSQNKVVKHVKYVILDKSNNGAYVDFIEEEIAVDSMNFNLIDETEGLYMDGGMYVVLNTTYEIVDNVCNVTIKIVDFS